MLVGSLRVSGTIFSPSTHKLTNGERPTGAKVLAGPDWPLKHLDSQWSPGLVQAARAGSPYSHKITPAREAARSRGRITLQHQRPAALIRLQKVSLHFLFNGLQDFLFYPSPFFLPSLSPSLRTRGLEWCTLPFLKTPSSAGSMEYTSQFDLSFVWVKIGRPSRRLLFPRGAVDVRISYRRLFHFWQLVKSEEHIYTMK